VLPTPNESHGADLFLRNYFFKKVYHLIREYQDAYGAELRTFLETGSKIEIVERDDGYIDYHEGISYYFAPYEEWADYEKEAIEYAFGRVVDVGCGAGRVALYLQNKGFFVIGIDNSPGAIRVCQERGIKKLRNIPFTKIDKSLSPIDSFVLKKKTIIKPERFIFKR